jgi:hypothetical protein
LETLIALHGAAEGVLAGMKNFLLGMYHQARAGILEQSLGNIETG